MLSSNIMALTILSAFSITVQFSSHQPVTTRIGNNSGPRESTGSLRHPIRSLYIVNIEQVGEETCCIQIDFCNLFNRCSFLEQMLGKDYQVLDIDNAIAERHRANITEWFICAPVINHNTYIRGIDNVIAVKVNHWLD